MNEIKLNVDGMVCNGCENRVKNALCNIEGIKDVIADHNSGTVIIKLNDTIGIDIIKEKIEDIGFEVKEDK